VNDAKKGRNENIDLSVGDIYGGDYLEFGLDSKIVASGFGKIKKGVNIADLNKEDIARSVLSFVCINIVQISYFWAKIENLNKLIVVGNPFECLEYMQMIQMSINYFSKDTIKTYFTDFSPYFNIIGLHDALLNQSKSTNINNNNLYK